MKSFLGKKELLLLVLITLFLAVFFTWPAFLHLNQKYIGDGGDNYEYASYQQLAAQRIDKGLLPFSTTNFWRFPVGFDFSRAFDSYITVGLGTFLKLLLPIPLSYNLTIYILMSLNGIFSYIFFKYLSKSKLIGIIGMIIYGFSFYSIGKAASHPNLLFIGSIPLVAYAFLRLVKKEKPVFLDFIFLFGAILVMALGSTQYFLMLCIFTPLYLLLWFLVYRNEFVSFFRKLEIKQVLASTSTFLVAFFILFYPQIKAIINGSFVFLKRGNILSDITPSVLDFFLPNSYLKLLFGHIFYSPSTPSIEKLVFIGFVEILVLCIFLISFIRLSDKKNYLFLLLFFLVPFILSLGVNLPTYQLISSIFPFSLIPETGRYFVVFDFFLSIIIVLFLNEFKLKKKNVLLLIVVIFLLLERLTVNYYQAPTLKDLPYQKAVESEKSSAVVDFPVNFYYPNYNIDSFSYQKPITSGYFHWSADSDKEKSFITKSELDRYICSADDPLQTEEINNAYEENKDIQMEAILKQENIHTLVVHKDDKFFHSVCKSVRKRLARLTSVPIKLDPAPTAEKQIIESYFEGKPSFKFFIPKNGTFYLDGVYIAPSKPINVSILIDNQPLSDYSWIINADNSMELSPKYSISLPVKAGTYISFESLNESSNTYFSLWYRYSPENQALEVKYIPTIKKVFDDDNATVYRLQ